MSKDPLKLALHFLKFRPRSEFEVRQKLQLKKCNDKEIDQTIEVLKRNKLLDDAEFAKMWVRDRNNFKPSGNFLIKIELQTLGLSPEIIESTLIGQNEEELALKALNQKSRFVNAPPEKKAQFLARRGFKPNIIWKIIKLKEE